ncbi:MAG: hypothetical protein CVV06_01960 [Gammaproteobacteria bacterium HGW-Gammaproteobacteria-10]|nr:MAG: hypothetical protein CVV06_01960 [Gammaproteobacteria bacterium HGW-Gammaproteobacteria-10]
MADKNFYIGFASAGAISAGAYSAGVLDFLILALDEWAKVRDQEDHQVVMPVFSGASAGSITSAIGMLAAAREKKPNIKPGEAKHHLQTLYDCWVSGPDLNVSGYVAGTLLSLTDLDGDEVFSLLNSRLLDDIAEQAFKDLASLKQETPGYFPQRVHLYMTQTNTRGVPYRIDFNGGKDSYHMLSHADRAHYVIEGLGTATFASAWANADRAFPSLDVATLTTSTTGETLPSAWKSYSQHTLASGAFPIGLSARFFEASKLDYKKRKWPSSLEAKYLAKVEPYWPPAPVGNNDYSYTAIDGGMINNHPFEYTRYSLMEDYPNRNEHDSKHADRTVIMVNPFPEPPTFASDQDAKKFDLLSILRRLFPTLLNQNRFKFEEMVLALDDQYASRWLISPRRYVGEALQEHGIACGLLGGFGGFVDRAFREHDYELGRKNCQEFLARWFGVASENDHVSTKNITWPQLQSELPFNNGKVPIIPLYGKAREPVEVRPWPRIAKRKVRDIAEMAELRLKKLVPKLLSKHLSGSKWVVIRGLFAVANIKEPVYYTCLADLTRRDQCTEFKDLSILEKIT